MKRIIFSLVCLATVGSFTSCNQETIRVSSEIESRDYNITDFNALEVSSGFKTYVSFSDVAASVRIEANQNLFEKIKVVHRDGKLSVGLANNVQIKGKETLNLYIVTSDINSFKLTSDSSILLDTPLDTQNVNIELTSDAYFDGDIIANDLKLQCTSGSRASIFAEVNTADIRLTSDSDYDGGLTADSAELRLTSDADFYASGAVGQMNARLSSDANLKDFSLSVRELNIDLSSDSRAYLSVSETINVSASSDAVLYYKGDAEIEQQNTSSGGKVVRQ
ncbi:MAG: DUF2807 domain-containing protein [Bacteroidota bacterium]